MPTGGTDLSSRLSAPAADSRQTQWRFGKPMHMSAQQHLMTSALLAERRAEDERAARQAAMQKPARPPIAASRQWSLRMPRFLGRTRRAAEAA